FAIFFIVSTSLTVLSRSLVRQFLRAMRRRGYNLRYALIVGAGDLASKVARRMMAHPEYGIILVGCLAGDGPLPEPKPRSAARRWRPLGLWQEFEANNTAANARLEDFEEAEVQVPIVGRYEELPRFLEQGNIDQVIVSLP